MTAKVISPVTAASSAPSSSTRSTPTVTGNASSIESDFVYGQFGENFTVDGLRDDEVCIGDRYQIGTAIFEVTQPRVTCYRVGIRMNDPRIPALLVSHRRPGFYFRVLEVGEVQAGDEIVKLVSGPEQMTVAEIERASLSPRAPAAAAASSAAHPGSQLRLASVFPSPARRRSLAAATPA